MSIFNSKLLNYQMVQKLIDDWANDCVKMVDLSVVFQKKKDEYELANIPCGAPQLYVMHVGF